MHDIFKVFLKYKMRFCRYMQGKESLFYIESYFNKINKFIFN